MLVREQMTLNPVTIAPEIPVPDALRLMRERRIRRLPVIDKHGQLAGIVSEKDLLNASPSPATSLSVWEITYLLAKLAVEKVMTREVITVSEDTPIEEAARIMADHKIGGLPVMRDKVLIGLITETDLFRIFLQLFGGRRSGVRLAVSISSAKGTVAKVANAIFSVGGDIVGLGLNEVTDTAGKQWEITVKVEGTTRDKLVEAIRPVAREILDVREM
jgi:acetoin utilization protein AcuB